MKMKSAKTGSVKKKFSRFVGIVVIISGLGLFLYPDLKTWYLDQQIAGLVKEFRAQNLTEDEDSDVQEKEPSLMKKTEEGDSAPGGMLQASDELLHMILNYNKAIFSDGQTGFKDAWSVTQTPDVLGGLEDGVFGYIGIPAMDVTLPLYIGASAEHMAKGAAVLGETSIPIGGGNTNSVIAGHRGYRGAPYFRDIEELSAGDAVYVTNPWETLTYRVESIDVIAPDDSDRVKIQEGRDMVTLLTCHPYRSHGKYRFVVYCVRDDGMNVRDPGQGERVDYITASDGTIYGSSQGDIQRENIVRKCGALVFITIICITFFMNKPKTKKEKRRKKHGISC